MLEIREMSCETEQACILSNGWKLARSEFFSRWFGLGSLQGSVGPVSTSMLQLNPLDCRQFLFLLSFR